MVLWYMYLLLNNSIHIHIHCPLTLGFAVFILGFYFPEDFFSSVLRTSLPIGRTVQFVLYKFVQVQTTRPLGSELAGDQLSGDQFT